MQTLPQSSATSPTVPAPGSADPHRTANRVYQGLTIAAMLLLLVSLWAF
jgi:hypothetical protein